MDRKLPPGMKDGLVVNSLPNGQLEILLVSKGKQLALEFAPSHGGDIAMQVLAMAKAAHDRSGKTLPSGVDTSTEWSVLQPSSIGLGPCHIPGHESLIVRAGEAQFGIAIPKSDLRTLGEALIALSAQGAAS